MTYRGSPFGSEPFRVAHGREAGIGRGAMAGNGFVRPFYGVRQRAPEQERWDATPPGGGRTLEPAGPGARRDLTARCLQYAARMPSSQFFWGETALVLLGAPVPVSWPPEVHVAAYRPDAAPRVAGVTGHRLQARERAVWTSGPLRVEAPSRAWVQASASWSSDDLVIAGDFVVARRRPLATIDELRAEAVRMRRPRLLTVVDDIRDGSESPEETRLRRLLVRAGLPEPALNIELCTSDGRFVARLDQAFPRYRVAVEYDGRQHELDGVQFAKDADRWDAIRAEGWTHVRILRHHMRNGGASAADKVRTALLGAGWRP